MGRDSGRVQNNVANQQMADIQQKTFNQNQAIIGDYEKKRGILESGGNIGVNPFLKPEYLRNQNLVTSSATSAQNKGTQALLDSEASRTGVNTAARRATALDLGRTAMRANAETRAKQASNNYLNNLDWQKTLLGSTLAPTGVNTDMFSSATSGRNAALGNLTQLGVADKNFWGNIINSYIQAAGSAAAAACWIAAELYGGMDVLPTRLVREWLNTEFVKQPIGRVVMALYRRFGQRVARFLHKHQAAKIMFYPLFNKALDKALAWKLGR